MFKGFEEADFSLFETAGLEERMALLKQTLRPKFEELGKELSGVLGEITGEPIHPHVAKHARRKTNPPDDSWVAFSHNKRGYKMMPHFQITVWKTHVLIQWVIIYESQNKAVFAANLKEKLEEIKQTIPADFQWSKDHMKPEGKIHSEMTTIDFEEFSERLLFHKKGEVMVGLSLLKEDVLKMSPEEFHQKTVEVWTKLNFLHQLATKQ